MATETGSPGAIDYRMRLVHDLGTIAARDWDALVEATCGRRHPALRHAFLHGLQTTQCAIPATGWSAMHLTLWRRQTLVAAVPLYAKTHSYGEYVFDWSWADAHRRHGLDYYPKLLAAIPFTPVNAPKLLATDTQARMQLARVLTALCDAREFSSLHVLFPAQDEIEPLAAHGGLRRRNVQFHWSNPGAANFDDYLATLAPDKRRKVRAERRKVVEAGVAMVPLTGGEAREADWDFMAQCYANTYRAHRSTPYLNRAFFRHLGLAMPEQVLLVMAYRGRQRVAATLSLFDEHVLYGRYWGAVEHVPCLHFEACYYTPIEFCIARGIKVFEGGAQGEHKMARGFAPNEMPSFHWLAHPGIARAVDHFLDRESTVIDDYLDELAEHSPFRAANR